MDCSEIDKVVQASLQGSKVVVKLCSLYKPILRRFRSYFRESFERHQATSSSYQHWTEHQFKINCREFMRCKLKLPEDLLTHQQILKMLFFILPCQSRRIGGPENELDKELFSRVFRENNASLRQNLFNESLIKYLWSKIYIVDNPSIVTDYIRFVRTYKDDGDIHADRLIEDL